MRFTQAKPPRPFHQPQGRENARTHIEYCTVKALVAQITDKALLLVNEKITPPAWVPLYRMDAASRVRSMSVARGSDITVMVELEWALEEALV